MSSDGNYEKFERSSKRETFDKTGYFLTNLAIRGYRTSRSFNLFPFSSIYARDPEISFISTKKERYDAVTLSFRRRRKIEGYRDPRKRDSYEETSATQINVSLRERTSITSESEENTPWICKHFSLPLFLWSFLASLTRHLLRSDDRSRYPVVSPSRYTAN